MQPNQPVLAMCVKVEKNQEYQKHKHSASQLKM